MLFKDTAPEAVGVPERRQRLHVYDRLYRGDLHVLLVYLKERLHSNVERTLHSQHLLPMGVKAAIGNCHMPLSHPLSV